MWWHVEKLGGSVFDEEWCGEDGMWIKRPSID
jgi:hypothetical protein